MSYLFTPPQRVERVTVAGMGLIVKKYCSWTVYNPGGGWTASETPDAVTMSTSTFPLPGEICNRPQIVPDAMGATLTAALASINANVPAGTGFNQATCEAIQP